MRLLALSSTCKEKLKYGKDLLMLVILANEFSRERRISSLLSMTFVDGSSFGGASSVVRQESRGPCMSRSLSITSPSS